MKKSVLLLVAFLFTTMYVKAEWRPMWHRMEEPVKVKVRQIDFYIFPNGEFDFNAHGRRYQYAGYRGVRIEKDRYGKIRRVGNVYINYNRYGQVSRIGSLFIKYNRRGLVERIGRKRIRYNRRGYYTFYGRHIKPGFVFGTSIYYGPAHHSYDDCDLPAYDNSYDDFGNDYNDDYEDSGYDDDDNYYYRQPANQSSKKKKVSVKNRRK